MTAVIAIAIVLAGVLPLSYMAIAATKREGQQKARGDVLDVNLTGIAAQLADVTTRCRKAEERADRLSKAHTALLSHVATLPAAGMYRWLLEIIAASQDAPVDHPGSVPAPESANVGLDTRLLSPGE